MAVAALGGDGGPRWTALDGCSDGPTGCRRLACPTDGDRGREVVPACGAAGGGAGSGGGGSGGDVGRTGDP